MERNQEPMSETNFGSVLLCYAEIEDSDWMVQDMWLVLTNQSA